VIDTDKEIARVPEQVRKPRAKKAEKRETVTLFLARSGIAAPKDQKATLRALGFRRLGQRVVRQDGPALRGMVRKVRHLVEVVKG
jgi:large subunit ribosomal protein L30